MLKSFLWGADHLSQDHLFVLWYVVSMNSQKIRLNSCCATFPLIPGEIIKELNIIPY